MNLLNLWWLHLVKDKKVYLLGTLLLLAWTIIVWQLSHYYGEQKPYFFDWINLLEWNIIYTTLLSSTFITKQIVGKDRFLSNGWYMGISSYLGMVLSGMLIDLFFIWPAPLFGIHYNVNLVYFDISLPSSVSHTVEFMVLGLFVSLIATQMQITRYKHNLVLKLNLAEKENLKQLNEISQLKAVQANVNPHFLYNSLNSVAALIKVDSSKAENMVLKLAQLFRYQIIPQNSHKVSLKEELNIVSIYLQIEKIRFGDQLNYTINTDNLSEHIMIPRLLLQPLVENAIKHGTSKVENGEISISASLKNNVLQIFVEDNGPEFSTNLNVGNGLSNIQKLLSHHYKNNFKFELKSKPNKQVIIEIDTKNE